MIKNIQQVREEQHHLHRIINEVIVVKVFDLMMMLLDGLYKILIKNYNHYQMNMEDLNMKLAKHHQSNTKNY